MYRRFMLWLMTTPFYKWVVLTVIPKVRFSTGYTMLTGRHYHALYEAMETGDWIFTVDKSSLTGWSIMKLTGGSVSHAAQCVDKGNPEWEIGEMIGTGYEKATLFDLVHQASRVIIADHPDWFSEYRFDMACRNKSFVDAIYDTQFDLDELPVGTSMLACSELLYHSDFDRTVEVNLEDVGGLGKPYISPQGLLNGKGLRIKADTAKMNFEE